MVIAGFNLPGCLPETEPEEFDTAAEGWQYLAEEAARESDCLEDEELAQELLLFSETISLWIKPEEEIGPDGYCYWVQEKTD